VAQSELKACVRSMCETLPQVHNASKKHLDALECTTYFSRRDVSACAKAFCLVELRVDVHNMEGNEQKHGIAFDGCMLERML
jgi:hypothetical protein